MGQLIKLVTFSTVLRSDYGKKDAAARAARRKFGQMNICVFLARHLLEDGLDHMLVAEL
jgi:hypothetical protein